MAYLLGEAAIRISGNAQRLHADIRSAVEKGKKNQVEIPITGDSDSFDMTVQDVEDEINELESREVEIPIYFYIDQASHENVIRKIDELENRDAKIDVFYDVHNDYADMAVQDFIDKWASDRGRKIKLPVETDIKMPKMPKRFPGAIPNSAQQEMDEYFEKFFRYGDRSMNVLNVWEHAWARLHSGIDRGIYQVYNSYFKLFNDVGAMIVHPIDSFKKMKELAYDTSDENKSLARDIREVSQEWKRLGARIKNAMVGAKGEIGITQRAFQRLKASLADRGVFGTFKRGMMKPIEAVGTGFDKLRVKWQKFRDAFAQFKAPPGLATISRLFGRGFSTAIDKTTASFRRFGSIFPAIGRSSKRAFKDTIESMQAATSMAARMTGAGMENMLLGASKFSKKLKKSALGGADFMDNIFHSGKYFNSMVHTASGAFAQIKTKAFNSLGFVQQFMTSIPKNFRGMRRLFGGALTAFNRRMGRTFRTVGSAARVTAGLMGHYFGRSLGAITRMSGRAFGGMLRQFGRIGRNVKVVAGAMTTLFGGAVARVGAMMARMAASKTFSLMGRGIRAGFRQMGKYAAGFGNIAMGVFARTAGILMQSLVPAIMAAVGGLALMGGTAIVGGILALAGAIMSVVNGALLMAPALVAAAGVSFATLKMGLKGVKDGVKAAFSAETVEDFEKAIEKLPPGAQEVARSLRDLKPVMDELRTNIQNNLTEGLGEPMRQAFGNMLDAAKPGMEQMASSWNKSLKNMFNEMGSDRASAGMTTIMENMNKMATNMEPVLGNLTAAFGSLAEQGSKFFGGFGEGLANMSESFMNWAEGLKEIAPGEEMSKFDKAIESAKKNAKLLGAILGGLFGTIGNILHAAQEAGGDGGPLYGMAVAMQAMKQATEEGSAGFEKIKGLVYASGDMAKQLGKVIGPLVSGLLDAATILMRLGQGALPGIAQVVSGIADGLATWKQYAADFGKNLGDGLGSLAPFINNLIAALGPALDGLGEGLGKALEGLAEGLAPVLNGPLMEMGKNLGDILNVTGGVLGDVFGALAPYLESTFNILNALLPVIKDVVSLVGDVLVGALDALSPIFTSHDDALKALLDSLKPVVGIIRDGLMGVIEALKPALAIIGEAFGKIIEAAAPLIPLLGEYLKQAFMMVIDVINWLMPFIPPLTDIIVDLIERGVKILINVFQWLLGVVQTVWPALSTVIQFAIDYIIKPAFDILMGAIKILASVFEWLYYNVVQPIFTALGWFIEKTFQAIAWSIENVVKPALHGLKRAFELAVDGIKAVWSGLKRIFSEPVKFFIDVVINKAVIGAWNKVMGWLKQDDKKMQPVGNAISEAGFASGGVLPGHSRGKDNKRFYGEDGSILNLAGGEGIMRQEFVDAVGGRKGIARLNDDARHGRLNRINPKAMSDKELRLDRMRKQLLNAHRAHGAHEQGYAGGGVYQPTSTEMAQLGGGIINRSLLIALKTAFPNAVMTAAKTDHENDGGYHPRGAAIDIGGPMQQIANWIFKTYPQSAQLIWGPGPMILNSATNGRIPNSDQAGIRAAYTEPVVALHYNHVHWGADGPIDSDGKMVSMDGVSGGFFDVAQMVADWIQEHVISKIVDPVKKQFDGKLAEWGEYGHMAIGAGKQVLGSTIDYLKDFAKEHNPFGSISGAGGANIDISGVAGSNLQIGQELAKRAGWTGAEWEALKTLWTGESGWDNNAQNPTSTAYGIPQFLDSTWASVGYQKTSDPATQIAAGIKYIKSRPDYGTPSRALALWNSRSPHWYDRGGMAGGIGHMLKNTLEPERVLSPAQTRAFNDLVYNFLPKLGNQILRNPADFNGHRRMILNKMDEIKEELAKERRQRVMDMSRYVKGVFQDRIDGKPRQNRLDDLPQGLLDMPKSFDDLGKKINQAQGWADANMPRLQKNLEGAYKQAQMVTYDPLGYLKAEEIAIERIEKEEEAAKKKAQEEEQKRQQEEDQKATEDRNKAKEDELKAIEDRQNKELDGVDDDEEKKRIEDKYKKEKEAIDKKYQDESDAISERRNKERELEQERKQAEEEHIKRLKETGEYYYGYAVRQQDEDYKYEQGWQEKMGRTIGKSVADVFGLGDAYSSIDAQISELQDIGEQVKVVAPSWWAAANGDYSGLNHNIAVASARSDERNRQALEDIAPGAVAGIIEMSSAAAQNKQYAPFIENVYTGASGPELEQALSHYEGVQARRNRGTTRTR